MLISQRDIERLKVDAKYIRYLVQIELAGVSDDTRRAALSTLIVTPRQFELGWDYGTVDERFRCWEVGSAEARQLLLVYCDQGFGPTFPWGFVFAEADSLGMDSQWHSKLEDAAICAGLVPRPPDSESPGPPE